MIAKCLLLQIGSIQRRKFAGKASVFVVTYFAYAVATSARLPYSIAKTSLRPLNPSPERTGWVPFSGSNGQVLLGTLDTVFMFGYAGAMPFMGAVADRVHQCYFFGVALFLVGLLLTLVGLAHAWSIHSYQYFLILTFLGGCFQSACYPCVIGVISKWFGRSNIGLILGVWSSCTPIGTIVGKLVATAALGSGWQFAFIVPGCVTMLSSVLVVFLLVSDPHVVEMLRPGVARRLAMEQAAASKGKSGIPAVSLSTQAQLVARGVAETAQEEPVSLGVIFNIPGMMSYCFACFFSKLAYYAFVFWLPFYLDRALHYDKTKAGNMSTFFDWGGFVGGIIGGVLSDRLKLRGVVLLSFQGAAVPSLFLYMTLGRQNFLSDGINGFMLFMLGFTVTTPYSLITSVMSTDLGRHPSLRGNGKAAATVTAILDGTGSFGAVLQGLVIGWISDRFGWDAVFLMLMIFSAFSAACLVRPSCSELRARRPATPPDALLAADAHSLQRA